MTFLDKFPTANLTNLPTPLEPMIGLAEELNHAALYIKRDDLTSKDYGGNKVRKLDFLLADVQAKGYKEVITFGYAGSNHCTATAVHSKKLGLNCTLVLLPQIPSYYLKYNLLTSLSFGAKFIYAKNKPLAYLKVAGHFLRTFIKRGKLPYRIEPGGSMPVGVIGFIKAVAELKEQIDKQGIPVPDRIYVPCSSMGTVIGLAIGIQLMGLTSKVHAIKVVDDEYSNDKVIKDLYDNTLQFVRKKAPEIPDLSFTDIPLVVRREFYSGTYAQSTDLSKQAVALAMKKQGIPLENTYSAQALGALVDDVRNKKVEGQSLLYWNTFNSADLSIFVADQDYMDLPKDLHGYFA